MTQCNQEMNYFNCMKFFLRIQQLKAIKKQVLMEYPVSPEAGLVWRTYFVFSFENTQQWKHSLLWVQNSLQPKLYNFHIVHTKNLFIK